MGRQNGAATKENSMTVSQKKIKYCIKYLGITFVDIELKPGS